MPPFKANNRQACRLLWPLDIIPEILICMTHRCYKKDKMIRKTNTVTIFKRCDCHYKDCLNKQENFTICALKSVDCKMPGTHIRNHNVYINKYPRLPWDHTSEELKLSSRVLALHAECPAFHPIIPTTPLLLSPAHNRLEVNSKQLYICMTFPEQHKHIKDQYYYLFLCHCGQNTWLHGYPT